MPKPKRIAQPGKRHRRDDGPAAYEVKPCDPVNPADLGTIHEHTHDILATRALLANNDRARILADQCGEAFDQEFRDKWTFKTPWIMVKLAGDLRARACGEYAMLWRPTFLATVALAHSTDLGAKAAKVSEQTVVNHRKEDSDFEAQVQAAQAYCIELLHSVTMRSALEGDLEPVYWQGIRVDYIKKFDNRLRVELLRAHMPTVFKTPGSKVNINTGNQILGHGTIIDSPVMLKLQEMRQISLAKLAEKKAQARLTESNDSVLSGTPTLPAVPPTT